MPILTSDCKQNLIENSKRIYNAYAGLAFFKQKLKTDTNSLSLDDFCNQKIAQNNLGKHKIVIENVTHIIELTKNEDRSYSLKITSDSQSLANDIKELADYSANDKLNCLASLPLKLSANKKGKFCLSTYIKDGEELGGPTKLDLYNTHLLTLFNIIEKLESGEDVSNLLVALATGSGKTFVQAIWLYALHLSDVNGVFAAPDKLITQFHQDLKRLLPDRMVDKLFCLRENDENKEVADAINGIDNSEQSHIFIASSEALLDEHYQTLLQVKNKPLFLSFDEQHLITQHEARRTKLVELSKRFLSMFLTATPSEQTYKLCGQAPVAIMSSGQKEKAGQGKFPELFSRWRETRHITRDY